jgi:hypothetical protein
MDFGGITQPILVFKKIDTPLKPRKFFDFLPSYFIPSKTRNLVNSQSSPDIPTQPLKAFWFKVGRHEICCKL